MHQRLRPPPGSSNGAALSCAAFAANARLVRVRSSLDASSDLRRPRSRVRALMSVALSLCQGAGVLAAGPRGSAAGTPGELVATLSALEEQGCFGEILEHITPDQREAYLFISWFGAFYDAIGGEP